MSLGELSLFPNIAAEQHQHGEYLQTARQHSPGQDQLAQGGVGGEIAGGADGFEAGTDVIEGTQHRGEVGAHGKTVQRNDGEDNKDNQHIGCQIGIGVVQNLLADGIAVVAHHLHLAGIQHLTDIPAQSLHQQQKPGNLQTAAGGAGAGAHHHQAQQQRSGEAGPQVKICGGIAGGGDDGAHLESGMADGFLQGGVVTAGKQIQGDQHNTSQDDADVGPQLLVTEHALKLPQEQQIVTAEIDTEENHEHGGHILQVGAVAGKGIGFYTEAAGTGGAKGMTDGFKQIHTAQHQEKDIQNRQYDVKDVQDPGGGAHFGNQLAHIGAGAFRPQQVHGKALPLAAGEGQQEYQHTHAAYPMAEGKGKSCSLENK